MQPLLVYVMRHGETDWNAQKRAMGQTDIPLNTNGRAQAEALAQRFIAAGVALDAIYSSDLSRATETAQIIATRLGCPVFQDAGLREIYMGVWHGLTGEEVRARYPDDAPRYNDPSSMRGWGESSTLVRLRVERALADMLARYPSGAIGIVTHGEPVRALLGLAQGAPYDGPYAWLSLANTGVQILRRDEAGWSLLSVDADSPLQQLLSELDRKEP